MAKQKFVIATKAYSKLDRALEQIEAWREGGTLKKGTSVFEVLKKAVVKNLDQKK